MPNIKTSSDEMCCQLSVRSDQSSNPKTFKLTNICFASAIICFLSQIEQSWSMMETGDRTHDSHLLLEPNQRWKQDFNFCLFTLALSEEESSAFVGFSKL